MTIAFVFFLPTGALISRYYKIVFADSWFRVSVDQHHYMTCDTCRIFTQELNCHYKKTLTCVHFRNFKKSLLSRVIKFHSEPLTLGFPFGILNSKCYSAPKCPFSQILSRIET